MTTPFRQVSTSEELTICHQLQADIFHGQLNLSGMKIPDAYDECSIYCQILDAQDVIGTYRVVLPNDQMGLPIEESGFQYPHAPQEKVCEMSRLVVRQESRGKVPFRQIIASACEIAEQHQASVMLAALLPQNLTLFKRYGFSQVGPPLRDSTVDSSDAEDGAVIPVAIQI